MCSSDLSRIANRVIMPVNKVPSRRSVLRAAATGAALLPFLGIADPALARKAGLKFAPPEPFSFDALTATAREMATGPYSQPHRPAPEVTAAIDYEAHGKIRFRNEVAPFAERSEEHTSELQSLMRISYAVFCL